MDVRLDCPCPSNIVQCRPTTAHHTRQIPPIPPPTHHPAHAAAFPTHARRARPTPPSPCGRATSLGAPAGADVSADVSPQDCGLGPRRRLRIALPRLWGEGGREGVGAHLWVGGGPRCYAGQVRAHRRGARALMWWPGSRAGRSANMTPTPRLEERKQLNNHLFGLVKWKGHLTNRRAGCAGAAAAAGALTAVVRAGRWTSGRRRCRRCTSLRRGGRQRGGASWPTTCT